MSGTNEPFDNPFAAPRSDLTPEVTRGAAGGLAAALSGDTGWTIGAVFEEAWRLTRGFKGTFWLAALALVGVNFLVNLLLEAIARSTDQPLLVALGSLASTVFLLWPLQAGILMLGVNRAAGRPVRTAMVGDHLGQWLRIAGLLLLQMILVFIGFLLLVLPGIYLGVSYVLAQPLLLDRNLGIWQALETSRKATGHCWLRMFGLLAALAGLGFAALLTLGIGVIWLAPLAVLVLGVVYRRMFGVADGAAESAAAPATLR